MACKEVYGNVKGGWGGEKNRLQTSEKLENFAVNHNYNKIVKSDWLSTALISALIGQFNRTVRVMPK